MPGPEYVGMHSPYARGDASTANGAANELTTIAAVANGAAAGVGLTTNGQALLRAANDLSRIGGTVNGRATLLDGFLINMALANPSGDGDPFGGYGPFDTGDPSQQSTLTLVSPHDYANLTPSQIAEFSLLPNMDGAVIDRVDIKVAGAAGDWGGGLELFVETQTKDGAPTIARIGGTFDLEYERSGVREAFGITDSYIGEAEVFREYVLPPGTSTADLVAGLEGHLALSDERPSFLDLRSVVTDVRYPAALGVRLQGGDSSSWSSEDALDEIISDNVELALPGLEVAGTRDVSIELKAYGEGVFQVDIDGIAGVGGRVEAPYDILHGQGGMDAGIGVTVLRTPEVNHVLVDLIFEEGHSGGMGAEIITPPLLGTQVEGSMERSHSGDDVGQIVTSYYKRFDGSGDPAEILNHRLAGDEVRTTFGVEINNDAEVELSVSKTASQTVVERLPTHGVKPWGDHYDLPPYEQPTYDKYDVDPVAPPVENHEIYLPIVGSAPESEPSEIYLPIVGAAGPAESPEPSLIQDMPPLERERLYLQEPELIYNPGQERETYIVEEGDNFWYIAEEMTALANGGEPVADAEFTEYWTELQELNHDNLRVEGNPDLIWAGQEMTLPGETSEPTWRLKPQ